MPDDVRENVEQWAGCIAGALEESEYRSKLAAAGFDQIDVEPTRIYTAADAQGLFGDNKSIESVVRMADGKFMSAFVRARKP